MRCEGVRDPGRRRGHVTRDYGVTANDKAQKLIQKLMFATRRSCCWCVRARLARGARRRRRGRRHARRDAVRVLGLGLHDQPRVAVRADLLDRHPGRRRDRRRREHPPPHGARRQDAREAIPRAVDEVGGPTILATFTVIAALLPMAFVSGLMGPYMSPIPINASLGMLISLASRWCSRRGCRKPARKAERRRHAPAQASTAASSRCSRAA
jgi:hypothetical protein